jgi:hypothetical protein
MDKFLKDLFDKHTRAWQVKTLSPERYFEYENGVIPQHKYISGRRGILLATEIYSERTAHLLNYIFNYKRWSSGKWDFQQGGGFIVDCGTTVMIRRLNEVCFHMSIKYIDFPLDYENLCVVKPKIYKMVKAAIEDYMKFAFINEKIKVKKEIDDNGFIIKDVSIDEFKVLIDYFDCIDVKEFYSLELINKVFGKKIENQFVISMADAIENQIKKLIEERRAKVNENSIHYSTLRDEILAKWRFADTKIIEEYDEKIKELEDQIKEMSANF